MSLDELKAICPVFEEDIYEEISMETCVNNRLTIGAPGKAAMEKVIEAEKAYLAEDWKKETLTRLKRYCKKCTKNTRKDDIFLQNRPLLF